MLVPDFHNRVAQIINRNSFLEEDLSLGRILRVNLAIHRNSRNTIIVFYAYEEKDGDFVGLDSFEGELEGHGRVPEVGGVSLQLELLAFLFEEGIEPLLLHLGASPQQVTT